MLMMRLCVRCLERFLPPMLSDHVIGDLMEQRDRGTWWILRQTVAALVHLRGREQPGDGFVRTFWNDVRLAFRQLRRAPAFAVTAIVTLGLAIGATASIFSVIDPVLLRPLPYPDQDRLAVIWERMPDGSRDNVGFMTAADIGAQASSIERWAVVSDWQPTLGDTDAERVSGVRVSATYFRTLGVQPALGRDFLAEEDAPGKNRVVILSHQLWVRRYNGDPSIVGKKIPIDGFQYDVAGVMPASFDNVVSPNAQIWRVIGYSVAQPWACRTCHHLRLIARIKAGVTTRAASTELDQIHARLTRAFPKEYASVGMQVVRLQDEITRDIRPALLAVGGAVVLVLFIAVANVVNLQLARAVRRREEFAIRVALGAGAWRLTRQALAEGLVLATFGGIAGIGVALAAVPVLVRQLPPNLPRLAAIHLDGPALMLIAAVVLTLALIMAVVTSSRTGNELGSTLRSAKRLSTGGQHLTRSTLVVAEVALAVMLLVSAGLVGRSMIKLLNVNTGFDATHLLTMEVDAGGARYSDDASVFAYHDRIRDAVRALPGVVSVAISNQVPLGGNVDMYGVVNVDTPPVNPEAVPNGDRYVVSTDYLATMRISVVKGRAFTAAENRDSTAYVALVSEALAARVWPGEDPIGKHFRVGGDKAPVRTVIGVTANVKHRGLDAVATRQWYIPERQWLQADNQVILVVRTTGEPALLAQTVRKAIANIDPTQPVINVTTMDQFIDQSTAQRRLALVLFVAFATAALLLAVAGIYGVLAGAVAERTREIGLRAALGASPREIVALILRQGGALAGLGIVIGVTAAAGLTRYLATFLFGVEQRDPVTFVGVTVVLTLVALAACAIPAMRAVRIDPSEALRYD
jgi:putative ABC transport system permease protein